MDKPHIEKEYKVMIDKHTYESLLKKLNIKPVRQVNYYYDVFNTRCATRIREREGKYLFTLKEKGDGFRYEYEFEIERNSLEDPKIKEVFDKFGITKYRYLGEMATERATYEFKKGELCLDASYYFDTEDYEIEFELYDYKDDGFEEFEEFLKDNNLVYVKSPRSKYKRFLDELLKQK